MNFNLEAKAERWYLCETNFLPEVRKDLRLARNIKIADCTLRDGEQQAGVVFTADDKVAIAQQLDRLGVHEIEVGTVAASEADKEAARRIAKLDLKKAKPTALARALTDDIDCLCDLGIWGTNISYPIGDLQRLHKLKVDDETYIDNCLRITEYARKKGLHVNFSPYDTTRCNLDFLFKVLRRLHDSGFIDRVRLVDTVGSVTPQAIVFYVLEMKKILKEIPVEIHVHDDFGMAMANTIAAVSAGADVVSSTINGVGERSGNAATEEVALTLQLLYGVDLGIDCSLFKETSELVESLSGVHLAQNKAIVGRHCFAHESGMAVAGMRSTPFTSEAYSPELVGQVSSIILGKKSGKASIEQKMNQFGFSYTPEDVNKLLNLVKETALATKHYIEDENFVSMVKQVLSNQGSNK